MLFTPKNPILREDLWNNAEYMHSRYESWDSNRPLVEKDEKEDVFTHHHSGSRSRENLWYLEKYNNTDHEEDHYQNISYLKDGDYDFE